MVPKLSFRVFALCVLASLRAAEPESHTAILDGHKIHYLSTGQGDQALIFIHGWTCDATFWKGQAPVYSTRRSLLVDLPGHGMSEKPEIAYTMDLFARAVNAVMEDAKVSRATLIGHSMGSPVAVQFLRLYPEKVAAIVIVDGFLPAPARDEAEHQRRLAQNAATVKALQAPNYKAFDTRVIGTMFSNQTSPALRTEILNKMLAAPQQVMVSAMIGMDAMQDLTERYPQVPVQAIMRKRPSISAFQEFLKQHFHLIDYQEWSDCGHFLMLEQPARFNQALVSFLDRK